MRQPLRFITALLLLFLIQAGVRSAPLVEQGLEPKVESLERRVEELERIRFYGRLDTVVASQVFSHSGLAAVVSPAFPQFNGLNYDSAVGSSLGANFCFFSPLTPPVNGVMDYATGIPMTNGTAFTSVLRLGLEGYLSDDLWMQLELAGATAQGDRNVAAWWGAPLPYLSDPFTDQSLVTRMTLDHLRLNHGDFDLQLGAFRSSVASPMLFSHQESPRFHLRGTLDGFGMRLGGRHESARWEAFWTRLADGGVEAPAPLEPYENWAAVAAAELDFEPFTVRAGVLEARNEGSFAGQIQGLNGGGVFWANPPGLAGPLPIAPDGGIGPQSQTMWHAGLRAELFDEHYLDLDSVWTSYRPNRASGYESSGNAWAAKFSGEAAEGILAYEAEYLHVGPRHDPFLLRFPSPDPALFYAYWRFPDQSHLPNLYALHSTHLYPHNRQGLRGKLEVRFPDGNGSFSLKGGSLRQVEPTAFEFPGRGFSPGWFDAVFMPLNTLEQPRGRVEFFELDSSYRFPEPELELDGTFKRWDFDRRTALSGVAGSRNRIGVTITEAELGLRAGSLESLNGRLSLGYRRIQGHIDPVGYYDGYAALTGDPNFDTLNTTQWVPRLALTLPVGNAAQWDLTYSHYFTRDRVGITADVNGGNQFSPYSWSGGQILSRFRFEF